MPDAPAHDALNNEILTDALAGLKGQPKRLSPKWFYDQRGSELFEAITSLKEYYPTRTETAILRDNAKWLAGLVPKGGVLVELGSGASVKTRLLLDAGPHFGAYVPIDISSAFLLATAQDLQSRYPDIPIKPVVGDFTSSIDLPQSIKGLSKTGFFPGSTIGNLDPSDAISLLTRIRQWDQVETFILGADLIKSEAELVAAYDDVSGVTAAFNLNLLARLNREAQANFDLGAFRHEARWLGDRIEMHLVSCVEQEVSIGDSIIHFAKEESIHTESCRKYTIESLSEMAKASGWHLGKTFTDTQSRFAVSILTATS